VTFPHNEYFAVLAEHGLIGASLLLAGVAAVIVRVRRTTGYVRPVALAAVSTFAVSAAFTQPLGSFQVLGIGWVLLGMASSRATAGPGTRASLLRRVRS
jgi:O-antigen ligase